MGAYARYTRLLCRIGALLNLELARPQYPSQSNNSLTVVSMVVTPAVARRLKLPASAISIPQYAQLHNWMETIHLNVKLYSVASYTDFGHSA